MTEHTTSSDLTPAALTPAALTPAALAPAGPGLPGQDQDGHVIEGVVIGHASCDYDPACTQPTQRVIDPYQQELYGEQVEIDICDHHLTELCNDI